MDNFPILPQRESGRSEQTSAARAPGMEAGRRPLSAVGLIRKSDVSLSPDVAQRLAQGARGAVPVASQWVRDMARDVSTLEQIRLAAGQGEQAARQPGFDLAGITAALEILQFNTEQVQAYGDRMRELMPSLQRIEQATPADIQADPPAFRAAFAALGEQAGTAINRIASVAEELTARNARINARSGSAADAAGQLASAMQADNRRSLQSVRMNQEDNTAVSRLLTSTDGKNDKRTLPWQG